MINKDGSGVLKVHKPKYTNRTEAEEMNIFMFVNNGTIILKSRDNTIRANRMVCKVIKKQDLTVYAGYREKKSKLN